MTAVTHPQAALLKALLEHVTRFPHLPWVDISRSGGDYGMTIWTAGFSHNNEPVDAHAVLLWAKTIIDPAVTISHFGVKDNPDHHVRTLIRATGSINGVPVEIKDAEDGDLHRWVDGESDTTITLAQLSAYVATGSTMQVMS